MHAFAACPMFCTLVCLGLATASGCRACGFLEASVAGCRGRSSNSALSRGKGMGCSIQGTRVRCLAADGRVARRAHSRDFALFVGERLSPSEKPTISLISAGVRSSQSTTQGSQPVILLEGTHRIIRTPLSCLLFVCQYALLTLTLKVDNQQSKTCLPILHLFLSKSFVTDQPLFLEEMKNYPGQRKQTLS